MKRFVSTLALLAAAASLPPARASEEPVSIPVSFDVVNTNTSKLPCNTDGKPYTVKGDLVALPSVLEAAGRSVTLYLHGSTLSRMWHLPVPGYDYAWEMAKLGHVSIAIDQLGYGRSGLPTVTWSAWAATRISRIRS